MQRAFIYGSCVTRDSVELWPEFNMELAGYVARQSLISATAPANKSEFKTASIASAFQRRMADGDIAGNIIDKLVANKDAYDVIIWDITDERLGVYRVPSGGYVSRVVDYANGIYQGSAPLGGPIRVGSAEHRQLWVRAAKDFARRLGGAGLLDRLVLNALPWATLDEDGNAVSSTKADPAAFNAILADYSAEAAHLGIRVAHTDDARVRQATTHQWGTAPFHYTAETYRASLEAISQAL